MKHQRVYLEHILDCIRRVENNIAAGREAFMGSEMLQTPRCATWR